MGDLLSVDGFELHLHDLYDRMWDLSIDDLDDGTRLFAPKPGSREALKWLIAGLAGTPVDARRTMPANNRLRRLVHAELQEKGWAQRLTPSSFRLLIRPDQSEFATPEPIDDDDDHGQVVEDVSVQALASTSEVLQLGGMQWSAWTPLAVAATTATTSPGVYAARTDGDLVYIGRAGERRGQGVRGRLRVYARGAGAVSGLGEAALDRALADGAWLNSRLQEVEVGEPQRAKWWAAKALKRVSIELCWTQTSGTAEAIELERRILEGLEDAELWNRQRPRHR